MGDVERGFKMLEPKFVWKVMFFLGVSNSQQLFITFPQKKSAVNKVELLFKSCWKKMVTCNPDTR